MKWRGCGHARIANNPSRTIWGFEASRCRTCRDVAVSGNLYYREWPFPTPLRTHLFLASRRHIQATRQVVH